jgi:hypothetical protein
LPGCKQKRLPAGNTARKPLKIVVGAKGFEPSTPWSQTKCATKLRYAPTSLLFLTATIL